LQASGSGCFRGEGMGGCASWVGVHIGNSLAYLW
jgi:hypothetical protein